jgi:hypothetical protein
LKKSKSTRSTRSLDSKIPQYGVYIGSELVANATSLEEIPILMEKAKKERAEILAKETATPAAGTEAGMVGETNSMPPLDPTPAAPPERSSSPAPTTVATAAAAAVTEEGNSTETLAKTTPLTPNETNPPKNEDSEKPQDDASQAADNNSTASSKTAFEVWVGGKLIGVAKDRSELPIIVAAAKAQEKLRRKLTKAKSFKKVFKSNPSLETSNSEVSTAESGRVEGETEAERGGASGTEAAGTTDSPPPLSSTSPSPKIAEAAVVNDPR